MIQEKIKVIEKEIMEQEKTITESHDTITKKKKEVEELQILETRLQKIYAVKNNPDLADSELANKVAVIDFLERLSNLFDFRFSYFLGDISLSQLKINQMLYLLFGDHAETDKKSIPPEVFRKEYFGE